MEINKFDVFWQEDYDLMGRYYPYLSSEEKNTYVQIKHKYQSKYNFAHMEFFSFNLGEILHNGGDCPKTF